MRVACCLALLAALAAGCSPARPTAGAGRPAAPSPRGERLGIDYGTLPPSMPTVAGADTIIAAVRAVLDRQVADWNAGDIRGFMEGYWRSDSTVMISDGTLRRGWQTSLYAYMRSYPDREAMGMLSFEDLHITPLAPDAAFVYGRYRLRRASDEPLGMFSLVFRIQPNHGWRILHDHTSSSPGS